MGSDGTWACAGLVCLHPSFWPSVRPWTSVCSFPSLSFLVSKMRPPALTLPWLLQNSKTLLDTAPNKAGTPAHSPKAELSLPHGLPHPRADPHRPGKSGASGPPLHRGSGEAPPSGGPGYF